MKFAISKFGRKLKLKNSVLIQGLPGIGNVGRIAVDFLIEKLKAKKYMNIHSYYFPNIVYVNEDSTVDMPKVEFWYKKGKKNLLFLVGDVQPINEEGSYLLTNKVMEIAQEIGIKQVITLGGIGIMKEPTKPKVYGAVTDKNVIKKFKKYGVSFAGNAKINLIIGAAGLLIGIAKYKGIDGISLLCETFAHPKHLGIKASKELLDVLSKYLGIKIPLKEMKDEIKRIERRKIIIPRRMSKQSKPMKLDYIG